jgi:Na+-driven multidrug efflux pump
VAAAQERDKGEIGHPRTINKFSTALQLSTYVGIALGSSLFLFARPLLRTLVGNEGISPEVFNAAMKYVRIRALGMPAAALIGSAQAGCLGMQDVKSPMVVLVAAALVNFIGDMLFVGMNHPFFGGAAGAAWATIFSQYFAVWLFFRWLCTLPKAQQKPEINKELLQKRIFLGDFLRKCFLERIHFIRKALQKTRFESNSSSNKEKSGIEWTTRGLFRGHYSGMDLLSFPSIERAREYALYFLPVTTTSIGRLSSYVAMSHVVSSTLGTAAMAAQQIIVSIFYCLTPIADSLSLTAQSIIPRLVEKKPSPERTVALKATVRNLFKAGGIFGGIMMSAVMFIPFITQLFTSDVSVMGLVTSVIPMLLAFFGVHGLCMASEGILLGQKDLTFIGSMYGLFFLLVPYLMLRVKKAALTGVLGVKLTSIWSIFVGYQIFRVSSFLMRCNQLLRRNERDSIAIYKGKP